MSPLGIASTLFSLFRSSSADSTASAQSTTNLTGTPGSTDFSSSLSLRMAALQAQSMNNLIGSVNSSGKTASPFDFLTNTGTQSATSDPLSILGLSASGTSGTSPVLEGRNLSLFDPESACKMMSVINANDVTYKAQFSELSAMKSAVSTVQQAGQTLSKVDESMDSRAIQTQLQAFADKYNEWIKGFDGTAKEGGLLAGTQAAEVSLYELEQSVENIFNGAKDGLHGLRDLGLTIDQNTNLASVDTAKLESVLASNKTGAVHTLNEFGANFARSAELLNSANNFIPNQLGNLDRVIDYFADHKTALQQEFGLGDAPKPNAAVAKALAAYQQINQV